jgi:hypothetical protein
MSSSQKRIHRIGRLAPTIVALALSGACISGAQAAPKPDSATAAQMALHFKHEDALYRAKDRSAEMRTPAEAMALHFRHEDAIYGGRPAIRSALGPAHMIARHFKHEDALYPAQGSRVSSALRIESAASNGFDWADALLGACSAFALMLLGAAAVVGVRPGRTGVVPS